MSNESSKCHVCGFECERVAKHVASKHPEEFVRQDQLVLKYYAEGLSARKISELPDIMYTGGTSVARVLKRHLTAEQLEQGRRDRISITLEADYAAGKYDWVNDINTERNKSEAGRLKNSEGLKLAYSEGTRKSWNKGGSSDSDERIAEMSGKISQTMRAKAKRGELKTLFLSGPDSILWKEDRATVSRLYRQNLDFGRSDRDSLLSRAGFRCQQCGISRELLDCEKEILGLARLCLECDHIFPITTGGGSDWENNGQVLCTRCHVIKCLKERYPENSPDEYENRYNSAPVQVLAQLFGGVVDFERGVWTKDQVSVYISPLTRLAALGRHTLGELKAASEGKLLVFYSDEWYLKRDIVLSIIKTNLGTVTQRVWARNTLVRVLSRPEAKIFFDKNHISGDTKNILALGLEHNGEVVAGISFRRPFVSKHSDKIEIARFASRVDNSVVGGFSKLLTHARAQLETVAGSSSFTILTYADLRFGSGQVYAKNGFRQIGRTPLDYYYTDGQSRYNRFRFRAQDGMSEADFAASKGVYRIYGCGSMIYEMPF